MKFSLSDMTTTSHDLAAFCSAQPVWLKGRELERNLFAGFRVVVDDADVQQAVLRLTGSCVYRLFLNGEFLGYGPARGPHGFYRVDEWALQGRCRPGANVIAVEVAGYNANSYYLLEQPSFLQAEVVSGNRVLASTGGSRVVCGRSSATAFSARFPRSIA